MEKLCKLISSFHNQSFVINSNQEIVSFCKYDKIQAVTRWSEQHKSIMMIMIMMAMMITERSSRRLRCGSTEEICPTKPFPVCAYRSRPSTCTVRRYAALFLCARYVAVVADRRALAPVDGPYRNRCRRLRRYRHASSSTTTTGKWRKTQLSSQTRATWWKNRRHCSTPLKLHRTRMNRWKQQKRT